MIPRRFAYCLEFDRRGDVWAGTDAQRLTIRDAFSSHLVFGGPFDLTMRRDAIGIDLDPRNWDLALERVGPLILERAG